MKVIDAFAPRRISFWKKLTSFLIVSFHVLSIVLITNGLLWWLIFSAEKGKPQYTHVFLPFYVNDMILVSVFMLVINAFWLLAFYLIYKSLYYYKHDKKPPLKTVIKRLYIYVLLTVFILATVTAFSSKVHDLDSFIWMYGKNYQDFISVKVIVGSIAFSVFIILKSYQLIKQFIRFDVSTLRVKVIYRELKKVKYDIILAFNFFLLFSLFIYDNYIFLNFKDLFREYNISNGLTPDYAYNSNLYHQFDYSLFHREYYAYKRNTIISYFNLTWEEIYAWFNFIRIRNIIYSVIALTTYIFLVRKNKYASKFHNYLINNLGFSLFFAFCATLIGYAIHYSYFLIDNRTGISEIIFSFVHAIQGLYIWPLVTFSLCFVWYTLYQLKLLDGKNAFAIYDEYDPMHYEITPSKNLIYAMNTDVTRNNVDKIARYVDEGISDLHDQIEEMELALKMWELTPEVSDREFYGEETMYAYGRSAQYDRYELARKKQDFAKKIFDGNRMIKQVHGRRNFLIDNLKGLKGFASSKEIKKMKSIKTERISSGAISFDEKPQEEVIKLNPKKKENE